MKRLIFFISVIAVLAFFVAKIKVSSLHFGPVTDPDLSRKARRNFQDGIEVLFRGLNALVPGGVSTAADRRLGSCEIVGFSSANLSEVREFKWSVPVDLDDKKIICRAPLHGDPFQISGYLGTTIVLRRWRDRPIAVELQRGTLFISSGNGDFVIDFNFLELNFSGKTPATLAVMLNKNHRAVRINSGKLDLKAKWETDPQLAFPVDFERSINPGPEIHSDGKVVASSDVETVLFPSGFQIKQGPPLVPAPTSQGHP